MELKYFLFAALLCHAAVSVNSANANARKLLAALSRLGDRVLSGAFGGYTNCPDKNGFSMGQADQIRARTQKSPAVYGIDCSPGWDTKDEYKEADIIDCFNKQIVDYAKKGGIISVSHHLPNPIFAGNRNASGQGALKTPIYNYDYEAILKPGTAQRNRWWNMMEKIASGLQAYKDNGVTILYRPLHEMNGEWFWWGALEDPRQNGERQRLFKLLWIDLWKFMEKKGLDNLLWVYSPDHGRGDKTRFYPGHEFVDIVGLDAYSDNPWDIKGYEEMTRLGKPFALAEVGPSSTDGRFDYDNFVKAVLSKYPKTVYFMPWNSEYSPVSNQKAWEAYNNAKVINLGGLRWWR